MVRVTSVDLAGAAFMVVCLMFGATGLVPWPVIVLLALSRFEFKIHLR